MTSEQGKVPSAAAVKAAANAALDIAGCPACIECVGVCEEHERLLARALEAFAESREKPLRSLLWDAVLLWKIPARLEEQIRAAVAEPPAQAAPQPEQGRQGEVNREDAGAVIHPTSGEMQGLPLPPGRNRQEVASLPPVVPAVALPRFCGYYLGGDPGKSWSYCGEDHDESTHGARPAQAQAAQGEAPPHRHETPEGQLTCYGRQIDTPQGPRCSGYVGAASGTAKPEREPEYCCGEMEEDGHCTGHRQAPSPEGPMDVWAKAEIRRELARRASLIPGAWRSLVRMIIRGFHAEVSAVKFDLQVLVGDVPPEPRPSPEPPAPQAGDTYEAMRDEIQQLPGEGQLTAAELATRAQAMSEDALSGWEAAGAPPTLTGEIRRLRAEVARLDAALVASENQRREAGHRNIQLAQRANKAEAAVARLERERDATERHRERRAHQHAILNRKRQVRLEAAERERKRLIAAISDIDAHAAPIMVGEETAGYTVSAGALHRALGAAGGAATSPKCYLGHLEARLCANARAREAAEREAKILRDEVQRLAVAPGRSGDGFIGVWAADVLARARAAGKGE